MATLTRCPSCDAVIPTSERRCTSCGASLRPPFGWASVAVLFFALAWAFWTLTG